MNLQAMFGMDYQQALSSQMAKFWHYCENDQNVLSDKITALPRIIRSWLEPVGGLQGRKILDFGCGSGVTALGLALAEPQARVIGIDIHHEYEHCLSFARRTMPIDVLPSGLAFGDSVQSEKQGKMDFIYSWSVFEHLDEAALTQSLALFDDILADDGHIFIQISPLYYSANGSHLSSFGIEPWDHLLLSHDHLEKKLFGLEKAERDILTGAWLCYLTLNKITAERLITLFHEKGFDIVRQHRTEVTQRVPESLLAVYQPAALKLDQIVLLLKRRRKAGFWRR